MPTSGQILLRFSVKGKNPFLPKEKKRAFRKSRRTRQRFCRLEDSTLNNLIASVLKGGEKDEEGKEKKRENGKRVDFEVESSNADKSCGAPDFYGTHR